jgi:eukaryotic-like serine/threonine-protein kinase
MMLRGVELCVEDGFLGTPYRPIARIGEGASAEVFEALGPGGARRAVKVLRAIHTGMREAVMRLEDEGRALSGLSHPNLVHVFDTGVTTDGRPYFTMPRLDGETLRDRLLREGPMQPARACALFAGLLDGLDAAHAAGIVHRDVKPANIFIARESKGERCVLLDFGIAKLEGGDREAKVEGEVIGTPRYIAPEQILGGLVDARTDLYSAGIVLFEMIAGRSPYDGKDSAEMMHAHITARPRRLRDLAPVAPDLDYVVGRALSKEPDRRWPSARAFAVVLERALAFEQIEEASR